MRIGVTLGIAGLLLVLGLSAGCVSVKAPEKIVVGSGSPPPVDSSRVPATSTHEEARAELNKAYQNIQHLERENQRLRQKADEYKRERDDARRRLEKYED